MVAFLVTGWAAFVFLVLTYWTGRMPPNRTRCIDAVCFRANSTKCDDEWKKTIDKLVLALSDQRLIAGLATMIAGFLEALNHRLDVLH